MSIKTAQPGDTWRAVLYDGDEAFIYLHHWEKHFGVWYAYSPGKYGQSFCEWATSYGMARRILPIYEHVSFKLDPRYKFGELQNG